MGQASRGERLARGAPVVPLARQRHPLERDLTAQELVACPPYDSEAAGAETLEHAVALEHEHAPKGAIGTRWGARRRRALHERGSGLHRLSDFAVRRRGPCPPQLGAETWPRSCSDHGT